ncbi:hypothetical protein MCOR03_003834 [Pyricularia oryzae]|nr:hypothetical protein MCOR03_003834 [Pyricularia oryzae]
MPKPLFELAPEWGEQPRKAPPLPAKSDLRKVTEGQFGQFGEILTPFRCKSRARGSVSSGSVDELYLACERAALRFSAERDGASPCRFIPSSSSRRLGLATGIKPFERLRESLPRPKTATGSRGCIDEQRPKRAATPTDWRPSTAADNPHLSKFKEGGFHGRLAHGAIKIGSFYRRLLPSRRQEQH